jgi:hypothetical protein
MPGELSPLEFALHDQIGGQPLTPENVDLPTLRGYLDEVEKFIRGDSAATLRDSRLRIEPGSVKVIAFVAHLLAAEVQAESARLNATGDLDAVQPSRAEIVEKWQARSRRSPTRSYSIKAAPESPPLRITAETQLQHASENAWVGVEKYLTGKVVDAGGRQDPNVHLVLLDSGTTVRIDASEQQLEAEKENRLYKTLTLRVQAEQHLRTGALRNVRLIEFLRQTGEADESVLQSLWRKGADAWRDVPSPSGWVETLRGNA